MLPSVLMISLLVTTMILGVVLIISFYNSYSIKLTKKKKLDLAYFSAIQLFMNNNNEDLMAEQIISIDSINVKLTPQMEGVYLKVNTTAYNNKDSSSVNYYLGAEPNNIFDKAIVISKPKLRATISGDTKIVGDVLGTSDKIKRGRISGKKNASNNYLEGKIFVKDEINIKYFEERLISGLFEDTVISDNSTYLTCCRGVFLDSGNLAYNSTTTISLFKPISLSFFKY